MFYNFYVCLFDSILSRFCFFFPFILLSFSLISSTAGCWSEPIIELGEIAGQ